MTRFRSSFQPTDDILAAFAPQLGADLPAYRNHVCRVLNFHAALSGRPETVPLAVLIAAAFHDLGIWTDHSFDYLGPSVALARGWLATQGLDALAPEVTAIVMEHHKLRPYDGPFAGSVETFRRADLVDLSLGAIRFGLTAEHVRNVRGTFPNAGFHGLLARLTARQFLRTPWRPLPMMHW